MEINQDALDKLQAIGSAFIKAFSALREAVKQMVSWIQENWKWLKEKITEIYQLEEKKRKHPQHKERLDFTRRKFPHQVLDR